MGTAKLVNVCYIVCNYNYKRYLEKCLTSVCEQKLAQNVKLRIVVIDGGSTDGSLEYLNETIRKYPHDVSMFENCKVKNGKFKNLDITFIHKNDSDGPSASRNVGIEYCIKNNLAEYFMILDADDEAMPHKTMELLKVINRHDGIGVAYADYLTLNEDDVLTYEYKHPFDKIKLFRECIVHSGSLVRKSAMMSVLDENGYYDKTLRTCEDYDLWMRISDKYMIYHHPYPLSIVRVHSQNSTNTVALQTWNDNYKRVQEKSYERAKNS